MCGWNKRLLAPVPKRCSPHSTKWMRAGCWTSSVSSGPWTSRPSIHHWMSRLYSRVVADMFLSSNVSVPSVNTKELGLYLALNRTPKELSDLGLLDFCPRRHSRKGPNPVMTGCAMKEQEEKRFAPWDSQSQKGRRQNWPCLDKIMKKWKFDFGFIFMPSSFFNTSAKKNPKNLSLNAWF